MSAKAILNEDWSESDDRKKKKEDRLFFSCEEEWERKYLTDKISKRYPNVSVEKIKAAIEHCCKAIAAPRPRDKFVACVMNQLGLDDNNGSGNNPPPPPPPGPRNPPTPPTDRKVG